MLFVITAKVRTVRVAELRADFADAHPVFIQRIGARGAPEHELLFGEPVEVAIKLQKLIRPDLDRWPERRFNSAACTC